MVAWSLYPNSHLWQGSLTELPDGCCCSGRLPTLHPTQDPKSASPCTSNALSQITCMGTLDLTQIYLLVSG